MFFFTFDFSARKMCAFTKQLNYAENGDTSKYKYIKKLGMNFALFWRKIKYYMVVAENLDNGSLDNSKNLNGHSALTSTSAGSLQY